jgi:Na+-driven multidrug efflux pump
MICGFDFRTPFAPRNRAEAIASRLRIGHVGRPMATPDANAPDSPVSSRELGGNLAGRSIPRQIFILALWPLLEQFLGFAVAATDQVLAGRFAGDSTRIHALDALAVGGYFSWLLMILQGAVGTGGLALIARATGAGNFILARKALGQAISLGFVLGIVVAAAAQLAMPLFIMAFALEGETARMAREYLGIVAWSAPFTGFIFAANAGLRGSGNTRTPFLIMTLVNLTNIGTSWLFTFGPAPFGGHGWHLGFRNHPLRMDRAALHPHRETLARIVRVGLPSAIEILGMWIINVSLLRMVAALPIQGALGSHILTIRAESLSFLPGFALGAASATLAGQYLGLGDPDRAKRAARTAWLAGTALMTGVGLLFIFFPDRIIGAFVPDSPLHLQLATPLLLLSGFCQPFLATTIILKTTFRGTGDTRAVMRYSYGSMFVFRVIGAWFALQYAPNGLFWIWVCMNADVIVQSIVFWRRFEGGKWLHARV